ncbi:MAG: alpha/beta hydrolase [Symploca sp. SIO2C1]|nr:alpha/beta hydrolase [Symploca sp. SIO2C1]
MEVLTHEDKCFIPSYLLLFTCYLLLIQQALPIAQLSPWIFKDFLARQENAENSFNEWFDFIYLGLQSHQPQPTLFGKVLTDEELNQLTMPTLFLTGENEIIYSVTKTINRLRTVAPNLAIKVIPNAGHDLTFAQPQLVNLAILDFLKL